MLFVTQYNAVFCVMQSELVIDDEHVVSIGGVVWL